MKYNYLHIPIHDGWKREDLLDVARHLQIERGLLKARKDKILEKILEKTDKITIRDLLRASHADD